MAFKPPVTISHSFKSCATKHQNRVKNHDEKNITCVHRLQHRPSIHSVETQCPSKGGPNRYSQMPREETDEENV